MLLMALHDGPIARDRLVDFAGEAADLLDRV